MARRPRPSRSRSSAPQAGSQPAVGDHLAAQQSTVAPEPSKWSKAADAFDWGTRSAKGFGEAVNTCSGAFIRFGEAVVAAPLLIAAVAVPLAKVAFSLSAVSANAAWATAQFPLLSSAFAWCSSALLGLESTLLAFVPTVSSATAAVTAFGAAAWTALAPIVIPVAAVAAAVGLVWAVWKKWDSIPTWIKVFVPILIPLKITIEAISLAFRIAWTAAKLFIDAITLPFRVAAGAVRLLWSAVTLLPRAIMAIPGAATAAAAATWSATKWMAEGFWSLTKSAASAGVAIASGLASGAVRGGTWLLQAPGRALNWVSESLRTLAPILASAGAMAGSFGAQIVAPMKEAAADYVSVGEGLAQGQKDFGATADAISGLALASRLTGKDVATLRTELAQTGKMGLFGAEAAASGLAMTQEEINAAHQLADEQNKRIAFEQDRLAAAKQGFWVTIGSVVAPAISDMTDVVRGAVQGATAWVREHKELISVAWRIGTTAVTVATVLGTLATAAGTLGTVLTPLVTTAAAVAAGFALWEAGAGRAAKIVSGELWDRYGASIRRAWAVALDYGQRIWSFASGVVEGVQNAILGGRLDLATTIALTGLKLAWVNTFSEISAYTSGSIGGIAASLAAGNWADAGQSAMLALQVAFQQGMISLESIWDSLVENGDTAWVGLQNGCDWAISEIEIGWLGMLEKIKSATDSMMAWVRDAMIKPIVSWMQESKLVPQSVADAAYKGLTKFREMQSALQSSMLTPEQQAARATTIRNNTASGIASRNSGADVDAYVRGLYSDAARADREQQIADLNKQISALQQQGDAEAKKKATQLQQQLSSAQSEAALAAEASRLRGDQMAEVKNAAGQTTSAGTGNAAVLTAAAKQGIAQRNTLASGTTSTAAALLMFGAPGAGSGNDQLLKDQLREQREQTQLARGTQEWQQKALQRLGPVRYA